MMNSRFSGSSGLAHDREVAVGRPVGLDELDVHLREQRAGGRAGHAVAPVDHDAKALDRRRIDEREDGFRIALAPVDLLVRAAARRSAEPGCDLAADLLDAGLAREGERAFADELCAGVARRVVRCGADQATVEAVGADEVVADLGRGLAGVEHVHALGDQAVAVARGKLRRAEAHVVGERDAEIGGRLARELGEEARERRAISSAASPSICSP